ncbi:MAG: serine/threonine-protein kinase [Planctomycetota bacterium]|jgi:hypothetical protein|nr:serine/threonine-protein kinase [Planctomycetota bacterium]
MAADPYIGRSFGNVLLEAKIGQGGMGMVYRGTHSRMDKVVAVKLLPPQHNDEKGHYQKRFLREGRTSAAIQHRNVVQVMDAGTDHGLAYLVLEYVEGRSLGEVLDEKRKLDPELVQHLGLGIAEGLVAIHAKGVVHRDIKPDNLLLGGEGVIKITDLGLARQLNDPEINRLTATGMVVGTPLYVSPEAIRDNKTAGAPSDVYSYGATLYHMLTGEPPFLGKTPYDVMRGHLDRNPAPVRDRCKEAPKHLANLVQICLAKDPDERPTPAEIVRILKSRHLVHAGGSRTTSMLGIAAVVAVVSLAVLAWQLLGSHRKGLVNTSGATELAFDLPALDEARIRFGTSEQAEWRPLDSDPISVEAGPITIAIEGYDRGRLVRWNDIVTAEGGVTTAVSVSPQPVTVTRRSIDLNEGNGVVFVQGEARGEDDSVVFSELGSFAVARFNGSDAWNTTVTVSPDGIERSDIVHSTRPSPEAYLQDRVGQVAVDPHHLVCWIEAEKARLAAEIPPSMGWQRGASQRVDPALNLDVALVTAVREWAKPFGLVLPDKDQAMRLSDAHGAPLWYQDGGHIGHWGASSATNALLALVPMQ